jgi:aspartate/methionine/tyrosine aminotransferase
MILLHFCQYFRIKKSSLEFATYLLTQHKVAVVHGSVFGKKDKGYFLLSIAVSKKTTKEGLDRIKIDIQELQRVS